MGYTTKMMMKRIFCYLHWKAKESGIFWNKVGNLFIYKLGEVCWFLQLFCSRPLSKVVGQALVFIRLNLTVLQLKSEKHLLSSSISLV